MQISCEIQDKFVFSNSCGIVIFTFKIPAIERVRLDVCVTTKNSITSILNANKAPASTAIAVLTTGKILFQSVLIKPV